MAMLSFKRAKDMRAGPRIRKDESSTKGRKKETPKKKGAQAR